MKTLLTLLILLSTIMVCKSQHRKSIDFSSSSWSETLQRAKKETKPIFLYAYTPSCHFCRQMEK
ncbi:MAG: thioredoxin, partial [Tunicatimonas sp.]